MNLNLHPNDDLQKSDMDHLRIAADAGDALAKAVVCAEKSFLYASNSLGFSSETFPILDKSWDTYRALQNEWMRRNGR